MIIRVSVVFIIFAALVAGCSLESRINRDYRATLKLLDEIQPMREVIPAQRDCNTCHKMFDMRSKQKVYRYYPIRISHKQHAKIGIDCAFCHRTAATSTEASDYLMPKGHADASDPEAYSLQAQPADANACKACHIHFSERERNDPKLQARCETCHMHYQPGKELPFVQINQQGIRNNHKTHADNGISCLRCHVGFDIMETTTLRFMPKMDLCMECHDLPSGTMRARMMPPVQEVDNWFRRADQVYAINCAPCHGKTGRGDGPMTAFFKADLQPRDHTDYFFMDERTDEQLFDAVWRGGMEVNKSVRMPAFEGLITEDEARLLIRYMRWLSQTESRTDITSSQRPGPG